MLKTIASWFGSKPKPTQETSESRAPDLLALLAEAANLLQAAEWGLSLAYRENQQQREAAARNIATLLMACGGQVTVPREVVESMASFEGELKVHADTTQEGELVLTLEMRDSKVVCDDSCDCDCDCEE